jgi:hypothetical protein
LHFGIECHARPIDQLEEVGPDRGHFGATINRAFRWRWSRGRTVGGHPRDGSARHEGGGKDQSKTGEQSIHGDSLMTQEDVSIQSFTSDQRNSTMHCGELHLLPTLAILE